MIRLLEKLNFTEDLGNDLKLDMLVIPGGKFRMGTEEKEIERLVEEKKWEGFRREKPRHEVTIKPFLIGKYPVTQAQYEEVIGRNPSRLRDDNRRPVECVSWNEAEEFCQRLSEKTGKEYRLPTEAEWEYACRAGTTTPYHFGENITDKLANYDHNVSGTTAVGKYSPNAFGLYDMHGNVWEWCRDDFYEDYVGAPNDGSAWISSRSSLNKVARGGSWDLNPRFCRSACRYWYSPDYTDDGLGFRVACDGART